MTSGSYVYAIVPGEMPLPAGVQGLDGASLDMVPCRDLAAVTSSMAFGRLQVTIGSVMCHEAVVEALRAAGPALPVRFGTVLADPSAVQSQMGGRYDTLLSDLRRLGSTVEFGLSVLWQPPDTRDGGLPEGMPEHGGSGTQYLAGRWNEYRRQEVRQQAAQALARELSAAFRPCVLAERTTVLPTERLAVRAAYLAEAGPAEPLLVVLQNLRSAHPELHFLLSGPWPPYSFVTGSELAAASADAGNSALHGREPCPRT